jgi:GNAT superfamily N-acetyltransferase
VVADAWQGRGLGSLLLRRLALRAAEVGVRRLVADTLFGNRRMLAVFRHAGLPYVQTMEGGVVHVVLDVVPADQPVAQPVDDQSAPESSPSV